MPDIKRSHPGHVVTKSQLKKLVNNYYDVIKKKDVNGKIVDLNPKTDSKSVWFTKAAIDALFAEHGCTAENNSDYGLRVYFAVHKMGIMDPEHEIKPTYHNQQTVILVPTKKEKGFEDHDLLEDDAENPAADDGKGDGLGRAGGLNHGKICPPETDCGCGC